MILIKSDYDAVIKDPEIKVIAIVGIIWNKSL